MYDTPYRVEVNFRNSNCGSSSVVKEWMIVRTGYDPLCRCHDPVFAYRLVDLLNSEENEREGR